MLFTNETVVLLDVPVSSIEDKQLSCIDDMQYGLHIRSMVIWSPSLRSFIRVIKESIRRWLIDAAFALVILFLRFFEFCYWICRLLFR
jgi:hypothetical protein